MFNISIKKKLKPNITFKSSNSRNKSIFFYEQNQFISKFRQISIIAKFTSKHPLEELIVCSHSDKKIV